MDGYSTLLNKFLPKLIIIEYSGIINIDNLKARDRKFEEGDLFFKSTVAFSDEFTTLISKQNPQIACMNIIINFNNINERKDEIRLCQKAFAYLGLKEKLVLNWSHYIR